MSRIHSNPPGTQDQQNHIDSRQPGDTPEALHVAGNEMEALRLVNQCLLRELAELTRQVQRPQKAQQACEGRNAIPQEEQQHIGTPRDVDDGGENSQTRGHDPYRSTGDDHNGEAQGKNDEGDNPVPCQPEKGAQSWEQRFRGIQQELGHIMEVVKGQPLVSMEALVQ